MPWLYVFTWITKKTHNLLDKHLQVLLLYANHFAYEKSNEDDDEFCIYLNKNKTFRVYKSKSYQSHVLSLNFGNFKKYIITKQMWKIFRSYIPRIDRILIDYKTT